LTVKMKMKMKMNWYQSIKLQPLLLPVFSPKKSFQEEVTESGHSWKKIINPKSNNYFT
jgi:hypothetical protein